MKSVWAFIMTSPRTQIGRRQRRISRRAVHCPRGEKKKNETGSTKRADKISGFKFSVEAPTPREIYFRGLGMMRKVLAGLIASHENVKVV